MQRCSHPKNKEKLVYPKLYKSASLPHPMEDLTPIDFGWILDGKFQAIKWFEGLQVPQELENVDYLSERNAEDSDIDKSDDKDALEINNDEIGIAPFYEDSLQLQCHFFNYLLFYLGCNILLDDAFACFN